MKKTICCIISLFMLQAAACFAVPWELDSTFGVDGVAKTNSSSNVPDQIEAIAVDGSGRIVAAGWSGQFYSTDVTVARYNADGTPDTTFGTTGMVQTAVNGGDSAYAVAIDGSGRILVAGRVNAAMTTSDFGLFRYNTDGSLDTTFDTNGIVQTDFGGVDVAYGVAIDSNGKIVVAGTIGTGTAADFAVARYNADGSLDTTFSTDGMVITDISNGDNARAVAIDDSDRIVVGGWTTGYFILARYNTDGSLDTSFGTGGKVMTSTGSPNKAEAMVMDNSGRIVMAGFTTSNTYILARYTSDGALDTTFDTDGVVVTDASAGTDILYALAVDGSGNIVAAGINGMDFSLARYNDAGSLDDIFDDDGLMSMDITDTGQQDHAYAVAVDGAAILAAGRAYGTTTNYDFAVARFVSTIVQYTVTAEATGDGAGTVVSDSGGINYSYPADNTGTTTGIDNGTDVVLTATAEKGSTAAWTTCTGEVAGNDTSVATCTFLSLDEDKNAQATFSKRFPILLMIPEITSPNRETGE